MSTPDKTQPLFIDGAFLTRWSACSDGHSWFAAKFPQGGTYGEVQAALRAERLGDYSRWLTDKAFNSLLNEPSATPQITADFQVESDAVIAETAVTVDAAPASDSGHSAQIGSSGHSAQIGSSGHSAQIGSSGDYAQIGSSGYSARIGSSGDSAQIGSSGDSAQIGSSGDYARIGSSGDYARIGSSGHYAQINAEGAMAVIASAGLNARVRAGEEGAVAVAYHDGNRIRFAVGYVGENLKALTWYSVNDAGEFVEVSE